MSRPVDGLIDSTSLRHGEELRATFSSFRGQQYIHLRRWYDDNGRWVPGKGLATRIDNIPWLLRALAACERAGLDEGLLKADDYERANMTPPDECATTHTMNLKERTER